jgi:hypothetical protein
MDPVTDGDPARLSVEVLAAYVTQEKSLVAELVRQLVGSGDMFRVVYGWAAASVQLMTPGRDRTKRFRAQPPPHVAADPVRLPVGMALAAIVAASGNNDRDGAHQVWQSLSEREKAELSIALLRVVVTDFARAIDRRRRA